MLQRTRLAVKVDNVIEIVGAAAGTYGVDRLVGFAWALICAGVLLVVAAEFIYEGRVAFVPLPRRPRPRVRLAEARQRARIRRLRLAARWERWQTRRAGL